MTAKADRGSNQPVSTAPQPAAAHPFLASILDLARILGRQVGRDLAAKRDARDVDRQRGAMAARSRWLLIAWAAIVATVFYLLMR